MIGLQARAGAHISAMGPRGAGPGVKFVPLRPDPRLIQLWSGRAALTDLPASLSLRRSTWLRMHYGDGTAVGVVVGIVVVRWRIAEGCATDFGDRTVLW